MKSLQDWWARIHKEHPHARCDCDDCDAARLEEFLATDAARETSVSKADSDSDSPRDDLALPVSYPEAPINDPAPTGDDPWRPCQTPEEYERRRK
jgi:hypothetical protein